MLDDHEHDDAVAISESGVTSGHILVPRYPDVSVQLTGVNGNAWVIISHVTLALREAGVDNDIISEFIHEATSGDYNNVLMTCVRWVDVI